MKPRESTQYQRDDSDEQRSTKHSKIDHGKLSWCSDEQWLNLVILMPEPQNVKQQVENHRLDPKEAVTDLLHSESTVAQSFLKSNGLVIEKWSRKSALKQTG
jgi:hypothetical protein